MCVEQGRHGCRGTCMQIRGQSAGAGSILLLHEYQGTNSGHPSLEASTLPDEPSGRLPLTFGDRVFPRSRLTQQGQLAMKVFMWGLDFLMRVSPRPQGYSSNSLSPPTPGWRMTSMPAFTFWKLESPHDSWSSGFKSSSLQDERHRRRRHMGAATTGLPSPESSLNQPAQLQCLPGAPCVSGDTPSALFLWKHLHQ